MRIRRARFDDAEAILSLRHRAFSVEAELYPDDDLPPLAQTIDEMRDELAGDHLVLVACDEEDRIVGSVRGACREATCQVGRLVVEPDSWGKGIGTSLMRDLERRLDHGVDSFVIFTGDRSVRTIELYHRLGYGETARVQVTPTLTEVHLEKRRTPGDDRA